MARQVVLLRGINLGPRNRVAMPALRDALDAAGFDDVRTYLQSGNVVLSTAQRPEETERACEQVIAATFGLDIAVLVRTRADVARVVKRNPLGDVATDPKRYQVTFLSKPLPAATVKRLEGVRVEPEAVAFHGREIYAWHPHGVARSKLWNQLGGKALGVTATTRNWTTVTALLDLARDEPTGKSRSNGS